MKKTAIITGAAGNLGQVTVKKFLDKSYNVIAVVSHNSLNVFEHHDSLTIIKLDLKDSHSCRLFTDRIISEHQQIDAVLLLAGGYASGNFVSASVVQIEQQLHLNFYTAYNLAQAVFEKMILQPSGGRIIFVGSKPGLGGKDAKGSLAYGLSKSLLFRLAEIINIEGHQKNITASVIVPSTMDTPPNRKSMPDADFKTWVKPEDVATAMEYICSDEGKDLRETILKIYGNA